MKRFSVLSDKQIEKIHIATLEILRRTGVRILDEEARKLLEEAGAEVDGDRVRIPAHLVEWAIRTAPPRVMLCDRNGNPIMDLEGDNQYYGTGSDTPYVVDPFTGERRKAVKDDIANFARVSDYLANIDFVMCMGIASDVPTAISDIHHFEAMVTNTEKPIIFTTWSLANLKFIIEMAEAVAGESKLLRRNPFLALYAEPISPLQHEGETVRELLYMAEKGLPIVYTPAPIGGATAPVTLAGTLVQGNAELLSGLVIAQLKREGTPLIYGGAISFMDMATTTNPYVSPEFLLGTAALTDLAHFYKLPMFSFAGCSDSKIFDEQAALEGALWTLWAALTGGNLIHDVGYIESGLTASFEMLVASDEVIAMTKRMLREVEVNDEALALDVIDKVGPGGHFLQDMHTFKHFRDHWYPKLINRERYEFWKRKGATTFKQRVNMKVKEILNNYTPKPLQEVVKNNLQTIVKGAETTLS